MLRLIFATMFFTVCTASTAFAQLHSPAVSKSILDIAVGVWELDPDESEDVGDFSCDATPLEISIDKVAMRYTSVAGDFKDEASILEVESGRFWIRYDDEQRLDPNGNPVEWAWVSSGPQHFYWLRRDWLTTNPSGRTVMRRRCNVPTPTS